jgi:prophage antirepressor-like protein
MNNTPDIFSFQENNVRVFEMDGDPWFVARDVCNVLEINRTHDTIRYLDEDEVSKLTCDTPGGPQELNIVSEAGLYSILLRSRKPQAKEFRRWVTHNVLPSIRKKGLFIAGVSIEAIPQTKPELYRALADALETNVVLNEKVREYSPKIAAFETFMDASGTMTATEVAQAVLGCSAAKMNRALVEAGVGYYKEITHTNGMKSKTFTPYQKFFNEDWYKRSVFTVNNGEKNVSHTYLTPKGVTGVKAIFEDHERRLKLLNRDQLRRYNKGETLDELLKPMHTATDVVKWTTEGIKTELNAMRQIGPHAVLVDQ